MSLAYISLYVYAQLVELNNIQSGCILIISWQNIFRTSQETLGQSDEIEVFSLDVVCKAYSEMHSMPGHFRVFVDFLFLLLTQKFYYEYGEISMWKFSLQLIELWMFSYLVSTEM